MADFYLISTELREPYSPRACTRLRRISSELRDDLLLVKISPSLPKEIYNTDSDLDELILASKHEGASLFPPSHLPMHVYICISDTPIADSTKNINSSPLKILDWGGDPKLSSSR